MTRLIEMVVAKGRSVVHDGKTYGQHCRISLPPEEAVRLEEMGFVLSISVVRGLLQDPDDVAGEAGGGSAGDDSGPTGDDSVGDGAGAATGSADAKNTTGKNAKKTGA